MTSIVAADGLGKRYGEIEALGNVTLAVQAGEIMALVGHNGAGKTTLMKLMLGLIEPTEGTIRIGGDDPAGRRGAAARRNIGFLPESVAFPGAMTGREIIAFYCRLKGEAPATSLSLLEQVGLGEAAKRRVGTYSKGMRQRLGLAQALIGQPRLLLLDEPTTGLDPALRREFYTMLEKLRDQGTAIVLSSHALAEIEDKVDRFALIGHGRLLSCDTFPALLQQAAMPLRISLKVETCTTAKVIEAVGDLSEVEHRSPDEVVLLCPPTAKMDLLHRLGQFDSIIRDVEMERPGLEEVYRALLADSEGERP